MKAPEAAFFRDILHEAAPALRIVHVSRADALSRAEATGETATRLIAFSTQIIAPAAVLNRLRFNAYNFHPGPPTYPGSKPSAFAVYEGASEFGVTLHQMAERVDSGPIVATERFAIPHDATATEVSVEAYRRMARLAASWADALARPDCPLPQSDERWSGRKRRLADYEALRRAPPDAPREELVRRLRACDGVYCPLPRPSSAASSAASDG
ncbi:MAG: hypothetical protein NXI21_11250 [Alphaproteobacteria bacterium]|nr:hypothetical protein [Alphaproteobacteria bacterium]